MAICIECNQDGANVWRTVMTSYSSKGSNKYYGKRLVCESCAGRIDKKEHDKNRSNNILMISIVGIFSFYFIANFIGAKLKKGDFNNSEMRNVNADNGLNMREHPNKNSNLLISIPENSKIILLESKKNNFPENNWIKIKYKDKEGYVLKKYLD